MYLLKVDSRGFGEWNYTFGGNGLEQGRSVQQTSDGGYIIAGSSSSFGVSQDIYLVKTDLLGIEEWSQTYGTDLFQEGYGVQQTSDGGYIIVGRSDISGGSDFDILLVKTNSLGVQEWIQTYDAGSSLDVGYSVQQTEDGGYIVSGSIIGIFGGDDVYIFKTGPGGGFLWSKTYGGVADDRGYSVQQTSDDGYVVGGVKGNGGVAGTDFYVIKTDIEGNVI